MHARSGGQTPGAASPGDADHSVSPPQAGPQYETQHDTQYKRVFEPDEIRRALTRIAHEILERTNGAGDILLLGIPTRGAPLAQRLATRAGEFEGRPIPWGSLDVTMYRDDLRLRPARALGKTELPPEGIDGRTVVIVDDVLYSGRTVRAALDALVTGWHGQRGSDLPGAIRAQRRYGRLLFSVSPASPREREGRLVRGGPVRVGPPEWTEAEATGGRE